MSTKHIKPNALVKQTELDCYDWVHEEGLYITEKINDIDKENGIYLFQAFNIDRREWGGVASNQIIIIDDSILDLQPIMENYNIISMSGDKITGIKIDNNEGDKDE